MTEKEWLHYFFMINNREATAQEIADGLARGEFVPEDAITKNQAGQLQSSQPLDDTPVASTPSASQPVQWPYKQAGTQSETAFRGFHAIHLESNKTTPARATKSSRTSPIWLWLSLAFLLIVLGIGVGGAGWYYQTGDIEGTWEIQAQYGAINPDGVDKDYVFKAKDSQYRNYLIVDQDHQVSYVGLLKQTSKQNVPSIYPGEYMDNQVRVSQWRKQFVPSMSSEDYDQYLTNQINGPLEGYYKTRYYEDSIEDAKSADKKAWLASYKNFTGKKHAYTRHYERQGDRLIITFVDKKGKTVVKQRCKRLSSAKAKSVSKSYQTEIKNFERYYKVNK